MITIRTISYNAPIHIDEAAFEKIRRGTLEWGAFRYFTRTQRLTLPIQTEESLRSLDRIAEFCRRAGIRWFNVPLSPWSMQDFDNARIAEILNRYEGAFCNIVCARENQIREDILGKTAETFLKVAEINASGSANFRFGASMNVQPDGPFFPFTYSSGEALSFSIGLELAEEINSVLDAKEYADLNAIFSDITDALEPQIREIEAEALRIAGETGMIFSGFDFSLAPLPQDGSSVITILNKLGISDLDGTGMLFATAFLTNLLKSFTQRHRSVGFSGVMYSLLEDAEYARINDQSGISLDKMIALSTMCGCGIDMVPIPYSTTIEELRGMLMEVACVSSRLHKPLGVRVLPVQSTVDGRTDINEDQDFIKNTKLVRPQVNRLLGFSGSYCFFCGN